MKVKCFGCDASIEARRADDVVDAFVVHGQREAYLAVSGGGDPELRPQLRRGGRATHRGHGTVVRDRRRDGASGERGPRRRLAPVLRSRRLSGNPDWASCYCLEPHVPATPELPERPWRETRATMAERLRRARPSAISRTSTAEPAGWVNASFRSDYGLYRLVDPDGPEPRSVIGVSCFVIAPPFRRHGIACALLDRVIADASARGASWIEGYPHNAPEASDAGHFRGPRSMYDARGFEPIEVREHDTVVRRSVVSAQSS